MKKMIFLIVTTIVFVFSTNLSFSYIRNYKAQVDLSQQMNNGYCRPVFGDYFEVVDIICSGDRCELSCCQPGGSYECSWEGATWCYGCYGNKIYLDNADGNELFDHAKDKINSGILDGSYTNSIIIEPSMQTIYRTVNWETNLQTLKATIDITITDGK